MSVAATGGDPKVRRFHTTETLAQSTATIARAVSLTTEVTTFPGGPGADRYSLAAGTEGQTKEVVMLATGEANLSFTGTATGDLVLTDEDDYIAMRFTASKWRLIQSSATIA